MKNIKLFTQNGNWIARTDDTEVIGCSGRLTCQRLSPTGQTPIRCWQQSSV
jgi:hypothetical protein